MKAGQEDATGTLLQRLLQSLLLWAQGNVVAQASVQGADAILRQDPVEHSQGAEALPQGFKVLVPVIFHALAGGAPSTHFVQCPRIANTARGLVDPQQGLGIFQLHLGGKHLQRHVHKGIASV